MDSVKELLIGYCDPVTLKYAVNAIGENGLTDRIRRMGYLWQLSVSLSRHQCYGFGVRHCNMVFLSYLGSVESAWLTEALRVMDAKETKVAGVTKQNLTVAQCHDRFQNEPATTTDQRKEEARLFGILDAAYKNADLRNFRNRQFFHLDLTETTSRNVGPKNIEKITDHVMNWYRYVGTVVTGAEPLWTTMAAQVGKKISKEFRSMMVTKHRADLAKEERRIKRYYKSLGLPRPVD